MFNFKEKMHYKRPNGFYLLFSTEVWERFGFYMVQAIIILYMIKSLGYSDHLANVTHGTFSAFLYLTPIAGGYLADRYLGFQRSVILGGILFITGYVLTALPDRSYFFWGLSVITCANGFFKPNITSLLGRLYRDHDPRREAGFTLFYMGINIGSFFPPFIAGRLIAYYGWHAGFFLAAIVMAVGFVIFVVGKSKLYHHGLVPLESPLRQGLLKKITFMGALFLGLISVTSLFKFSFIYPEWTRYLLEFSGVLVIFMSVFFLLREPKGHRGKLFACFILIIISLFFWMLYNQTFSSLTLFADRNMVPYFLGFSIDATFMQSFNSFFIILLSPILSVFWLSLSKNHQNPSIPLKFSTGLLLTSIGFIVLALGSRFFAQDGFLSPWWLVGSYFFQTIGELLLSPIGLSMITVLAPKHLVGMMMGIWFFVQAMAFVLGEYLADLAEVPQGATVLESLAIYSDAFTIFALLSLIFAIISFMLMPFLRRLIGYV